MFSSIYWFKLSFSKVPWMKKKLSPPFNAEDDLVLEIVVFLGTCLTDASAAQVNIISFYEYFWK